jgi:hypothetical protein
MSGWKKVRNLFWVAETPAPDQEAPAAEELSDAEFAALLSGSEHAVPPGQAEKVPPADVRLAAGEAGAVQIDFQEQYNLAQIPDTDEVEQLEAFLGRLDLSLPQSSKIAAAEAFLGAIGKDRNAVLVDAERKIKRVRGLMAAQEQETRNALGTEQAEIDRLAQQIEVHRKRMEEINRILEGVRRACQAEESRLQAARVFFGSVMKPGTPPAGQR